MENNNFPIALRFRPTKKEKLAYLLYKVNGKQLPCNNSTFVATIDDFYGEHEPWNIFKGLADHDRKQPIGLLKRFNCFKTREKRGWILEEYTLADKFKCCAKDEYKDYAFCTVKKVARGDFDTGDIGSLEVFFDQMLRRNNISSRCPKRFGIDTIMNFP
ncbi:PREDICTED: uncharacterized protein LOC105950375 [Erythranthe guttata]|uniref:uncharacterized protein LOC105950375 n=1 Tax=Erythranthe guttata TaxID=4155 RepID=UPI00064DB1C0|nr:PREDICTED: uncharacterized protein LOC105950375 [Erythranthe guttata]|eukprot:XP_012829176.1 PREDICTED: uncharacterized protein LOC105950375 [Erythranthe guttata]